jgi:hypothetical protein
MEHKSIISAIDAEISRVEQARKLLAQGIAIHDTILRATAKTAKRAKKRVLSPEARARIAAAQKKRWAAVRKAAK